MINLLPYKERKEVARETVRRFLVVAFTLISIIVLVGIFLMVPIYFLLKGEKADLSRIEELSRRGDDAARVASVNKEIEKLNSRLVILEGASGSQAATEVFRKIVALRTPGISINGFSYVGGDASRPHRVAINGEAGTREDLVSFEKTLKESGFAENVVSPLANILKKTDIEFAISFDIKR